MNSLKLDKNYELVLENNSFVLIDGREAIKQHVAVRFGIFRGEFRYDIDVGVPYYQDILVKKPSLAVVADDLKGTVLDTPGITELRSFSFDYAGANRKATTEFVADSTEGVIDFSQEVSAI